MLTNAYFLAKFHFDTAEKEPCKVRMVRSLAYPSPFNAQAGGPPVRVRAVEAAPAPGAPAPRALGAPLVRPGAPVGGPALGPRGRPAARAGRLRDLPRDAVPGLEFLLRKCIFRCIVVRDTAPGLDSK